MKTLVLGSCFAANIGEKMQEKGMDVCINPFGTLFNPVSIFNSIKRLESGKPFREEECVQMGAGSQLWGSFSHYTKFARESKSEFLSNANEALENASKYYQDCDRLIITFGTAYVFRHIERDIIVSNCLKRPAKEFERFALSVQQIVDMYKDVAPDKEIIYTVSPVRHLADTAHGNNLSKATLLLSIDKLVKMSPDTRSYFPAYEILLDELRDYRWYADDKVHPSSEAVDLICSRFLD